MPAAADYPRVEVKSRAQWRRWLAANHAKSGPIWLVRWKKGKGPHVPWSDVVDEALCFGWIDSLPRKLDDERSMLLLAPRKPKSAWSKINKDKAAKLIASGLMMPPGRAAIETAKRNGSWVKLDGVDTLKPPADLAAALAARMGAAVHFDAFPPSVKRGILEWVAQAKRPETRARRIEETARLAAENKRANQWR